MKTGFCSVCQREDVKRINKAIEDGWSYNAVKDTFPTPPAKATFFKHKEHVTSPLVTAAQAARSNPVIKPRTNKEVLEAIRDIGLQNAIDDPSKITANHAIRAAAILSEREKTHNVQIVLAELVQGPPPPMMIETETIVEGDYSERRTD